MSELLIGYARVSTDAQDLTLDRHCDEHRGHWRDDKAGAHTASKTATRTGNTGVSTKQPTRTAF